MPIKSLAAVALSLAPATAVASETVTYTYDAKGRLTTVARSGSTNNNIVASYAFDRADNRSSVTVSGSPLNGPPVRTIIVPLRGGTPIPVPDP